MIRQSTVDGEWTNLRNPRSKAPDLNGGASGAYVEIHGPKHEMACSPVSHGAACFRDYRFFN